MNNKTVFVRTGKGEDEVHSRTTRLPGDIKRALLMVDGIATCGEISKHAAPSLRAGIDLMLKELEKNGYIVDKAKAGNIPKMSVPLKMSAPLKIQPADDDAGDLDFMSGFEASFSKGQTVEQSKAMADAEKLKAEKEAKAKQEIDAANLKSQQEAARIREIAKREMQQADAEIKAHEEAARLRAEQAIRARIGAERKAQQQAEAARVKAEQEAALAREAAERLAGQEQETARFREEAERENQQLAAKAEAETRARVLMEEELKAARIKAEQEVARVREEAEREKQRLAAKVEAEEQARALIEEELKAARIKAEAEAKERAEALARQEIEAARLNAQQEAEDARIKAEQEVARVREEAEREKQRLAAKAEAEEQARALIEEELKAARIKAEAEAKERAEALARQEIEAAMLKAQQEAETARIKAEQEVARVREEAEREKQRLAAKAEAEEQARALIEEELKAARIKAEAEAKERAEALARQEIEAARLNAQQEAAARTQADGLAGGAQPNPFAISAGEAPESKPDTFAFDTFHFDAPHISAEQHKADQSAQQPGSIETVDSAGKPNTFGFDLFKINLPHQSIETLKIEKVGSAKQTDAAPRAAQPIESRQIVQQEALAFVASQPSVGAPSEEEIQRVSQERIVVEERTEQKALAANIPAESQEKEHVEAKYHAAEAVRAEIEHAVEQVKYAADAAKQAPAARVRRKPFSWGKLAGFFFKLGVFLLVLLVGALFVVPYALPTRDYMPRAEKLLFAKLHQPAHIGRLSMRILPTPRLEMGEIYIGEMKQFQAEQALIYFDFTGLFNNIKPISSIELQGVKVSGAGLLSVSKWMQLLAADNQYPIACIMIDQGALEADAVNFNGVEGALNFNNVGEFTKANLRSNGGKYLLDISAAQGSKLQVAIKVRDSSLPLLPSWPFDELTATGELTNSDLLIKEFNGRIFDGDIRGNASINWRSGWVAQGTMVANKIAMQRLHKLLEGNIDGSARFKMSAEGMAGLTDSATLDGSFAAKKGVISGMDIVETARTHSREHLPGGRTHFDELSGDFNYANGGYHLRQVKISAGVLNATGTLDLTKRQMAGSIVAKLTFQESVKPVSLQIGGTFEMPILRYVP